jgi:hypothetical protein
MMTIVRRLSRIPAQNANKKTIQLTLACAGETQDEYANDSGAGRTWWKRSSAAKS